jgi:hypothetical protein
MADYGANITYASFPDYDDWGWDNYWGCSDWMIWYDRLEEYYGTDEARNRWRSAWEKQDVTSGTWDCLYNDQFREFVETNQLGVESFIADTVTTVQNTAKNTLDSFGWISKNLKWILPVGLIVVGVGYLVIKGGKFQAATKFIK